MPDLPSATWQECRRLADRAWMRLRQVILQRQTSQAERLLGELAWQQADFAESDSEARALQNAEGREAQLLFEIGEIREQIAHISAALAEENARALQEIASAEAQAEAAEQRALAQAKMLQVETTLGSLDFVLQRIQKALEAEEDALLQARAEVQDRKLALEEMREKNAAVIRQLRASLKRLQMERSQLQRKKGRHFLEIGRELADAEIAPLNQPEALAQVLHLRRTRCQLQEALSLSLQTSQAASVWPRAFAKIIFALFLLGSGYFFLQVCRSP